jgi:transcriptional regulator with XRE-family HTH domain
MPAIAEFLGYSPLLASQSISELLARKRRDLGWTQKTAAARLGVDTSTWGDWERGRVILRKDHRTMIAKFIDVPAAVLTKAMRAQWNHLHPKRIKPGL